MTIIESGYSSADEPQHYQQQHTSQFQPNSSTILEEPSIQHYIDTHNELFSKPNSTLISSNDMQLQDDQPIYENLRHITHEQSDELDLDPLSYEQFIYDYFSTYARHLRNDDRTLILLNDGQQIQMSHIRLPSNDNFTISKNVYLEAIDEYPSPFETESDQLVIFIHGEPIVLPADRWLFYKRKYYHVHWIHKLERVNRQLPTQLMSMIEDWLCEHTIFVIDRMEMNVDSLNVRLTGRLGKYIFDRNQIYQSQSNQNYLWSELLKYLIRTGYVSFDSDEQLVHVGHSELDVRRILTLETSPSPELIECLAYLLRSLDDIHFNNTNGTLILGENFVIPNEYTTDLFQQHELRQTLTANEVANLLLQICDREESEDGQSLILTLNGQILQSTPSIIHQKQEEEDDDDEIDDILFQWLSDNAQCSSEQEQIFLISYRIIPNYLIRIGGQDG